MENRRVDKIVKCPFYIQDGKNGILCEGVCKGTSIQLNFKSDKIKNRYKCLNCHSAYKGCALAKMLYAKYGEEAN